MNKETADKLIRDSRQNYDSFAESFSLTRGHLWPGVGRLLEGNLKAGDKVLDIGCGNGRFFDFFREKGAKYTGVDNSEKLISIARAKFPGADFKIADALNLPFGGNVFDSVFSLAVLHHIPSGEYRQKFFEEAMRALKPGGIMIVMVWDLRPLSMIKAGRWKRLKSFIWSQIKIILGAEQLDLGDFFIPWQNRYERYVHAFTLPELGNLAKAAGFIVEKSGVMKLGENEGNLYIIAKK